MGPVLSSLVDLQAVENELRNARAKLKKANQTLLRQQNKIKQLQDSILAQKEQIRNTRMEYDRQDLERKSRDEDIAKMRVALNTARTNKEYSSVLSRINTDKADLSKLEEQLLQLLMEVESKQKLIVETEAQVKVEEENLALILSDIEATRGDIQLDIDRLEERKEQLSSKLDPKLKDIFERLAERNDGDVMSEITEKDRICSGCYMGVPLELVNRLLTRDEVRTCPSCGRILFMKTGH